MAINILCVARSARQLERLVDQLPYVKPSPSNQEVHASYLSCDVTRDAPKIVTYVARYGSLDAVYYMPGIFVDPKASATAVAYGYAVNCGACVDLLTRLHAAGTLTADTKVLLCMSSVAYASDLPTRTLNGGYWGAKRDLLNWAYTTDLPCSFTCSAWTLINNKYLRSVPTIGTDDQTGRDVIRFKNVFIDPLNVLSNLSAINHYGVHPHTVAVAAARDVQSRRAFSYNMRWIDSIFIRYVTDVMPCGFLWYSFAVQQLLLTTVPMPILLLSPAAFVVALMWFPPIAIPLLYLLQFNPLPLFVPQPGFASLKPLRALVVNAAMLAAWWVSFAWTFGVAWTFDVAW